MIPIIAADRRQARQVLGYLKGMSEVYPLCGYRHRTLRDSIELNCGLNIEVHTASYRSVRGYTVVGTVADEVAFWRTDDGAANPDTEVLQALRPGMATVPDALLLGLSSPYAAKGELHRAVERSFGRDDPRVLVWNADTRSMNPGSLSTSLGRPLRTTPSPPRPSTAGTDGSSSGGTSRPSSTQTRCRPSWCRGAASWLLRRRSATWRSSIPRAAVRTR